LIINKMEVGRFEYACRSKLELTLQAEPFWANSSALCRL
jgi:hypothetical protein